MIIFDSVAPWTELHQRQDPLPHEVASVWDALWLPGLIASMRMAANDPAGAL